MKKIIALFMLMFIMLACAVAEAPTDVDIVYTFEGPRTLAWDPPATDSNGDPIDPLAVISYDVFMYDYTVGVADPQDPGELVALASTSAEQYSTVFPYSTSWAVGVRAVVQSPDLTVTVISDIAWSYIPEDADLVSGPFLYVPIFPSVKPSGLRDQ